MGIDVGSLLAFEGASLLMAIMEDLPIQTKLPQEALDVCASLQACWRRISSLGSVCCRRRKCIRGPQEIISSLAVCNILRSRK